MRKREIAELGQAISMLIAVIGILIELSLPGVEDILPSLMNMPVEDMSTYMKKLVSGFIILAIGEVVGNFAAIILASLRDVTRFF